MLLAIVQTLPPIPGKATSSTQGTAQSVKKNPDNNQAPSTTPPPVINSVTPKPEENPRNPPTSEDAGQSISVSKLPPVSVGRNWADWVLWGFNGLLVIAGFLGIRVAYKTLKTIERQARSTHHQAVQVRRQTDLLNKSAQAAQKAAEAALLNAEVLINTERALIDIYLTAPISHINEETGEEIPGVTLDTSQFRYGIGIANYGKTVGIVISHKIWFDTFESNFTVDGFNSSREETDHKFLHTGEKDFVLDHIDVSDMFDSQWDAIKTKMKTGMLRLDVRYRDVIGGEKALTHETTAIYRWDYEREVPARLPEYDDYR